MATVSNVAANRGVVECVAEGTTVITVSLDGITSPGVTLEVTAAQVALVRVTTQSSSIVSGSSAWFYATADYSDGTTKDVTNVVTWSSSNPVVGTISNTEGSRGLLTTKGAGITVVQAKYENPSGGTLVGSATVTVKKS